MFLLHALPHCYILKDLNADLAADPLRAIPK